MRTVKLFFIFIISITYSCQSTRLPEPKSVASSHSVVKDILGFVKNKEKLCSSEEIPEYDPEAHFYILLERIENCAGQSHLIEDLPAWMKSYAYRVSRQQAIKSKNPELLATSTLAHIEYLDVDQAKIDLLQESLKLIKLWTGKANLILASKLVEIAPRFNPNPKPDQFLELGIDFMKQRAFEKARIYFKKIIDGKTADNDERRWKALERYTMTYKLGRSAEDYLESLKYALKKSPQILALMPENEKIEKEMYWPFLYARRLWTRNETSAAIKYAAAFLSRDLSPKNKAYLYFLLASMKSELKQEELAESYLKKSIKILKDNQINDEELLDKVVWKSFWEHYQAGRLSNAINVFKGFDMESLGERARYWQALALGRLGKKNEAKEILLSLTKNPFSYYGILSALRIGKALKPIRYQQVEWNDLNREAQWAILFSRDDLLKDLAEFKDFSLEQKVKMYYYVERYSDVFTSLRGLSAPEYQNFVQKNPHLLFPLAYLSHFTEQTEDLSKVAYGLAITRQESAFDPSARSPADAFGLMQIIPSEAERISKKLRVSYEHFGDLYQPSLNIQIGMSILTDHVKKHGLDFINSTASYNAGKSPVNRWRSRWKDSKNEDFIEKIPYRETQKYVKLVFRNYVTYLRLLSDESIQVKAAEFY